jgi:FkbM family methyltransferase
VSEPPADSDPLVSFAPNGEDIVLWRALGHLTPGYFVDVGACHPVVSSITKLFSLRGWRGINIEPLPHLIAELERDRPDDINLRSALSDSEGELTLYVIVDDMQRTTLSASLAELYRRDGHRIIEQPTPVHTLNTVLRDHPLPRIDFLKIDAEGMEDAIVRGLDLTAHQPLVIVAEEGSHQAYEFPQMLADAGYRELLWDGLNRFFASPAADDDLCRRLSYPAGVLDGYVHSDLLEAQRAAERANRRVEELDAHINDIHRSSTWRVGSALHAPVRLARRWTSR